MNETAVGNAQGPVLAREVKVKTGENVQRPDVALTKLFKLMTRPGFKSSTENIDHGIQTKYTHPDHPDIVLIQNEDKKAKSVDYVFTHQAGADLAEVTFRQQNKSFLRDPAVTLHDAILNGNSVKSQTKRADGLVNRMISALQA